MGLQSAATPPLCLTKAGHSKGHSHKVYGGEAALRAAVLCWNRWWLPLQIIEIAIAIEIGIEKRRDLPAIGEFTVHCHTQFLRSTRLSWDGSFEAKATSFATTASAVAPYRAVTVLGWNSSFDSTHPFTPQK